MKIQYENFNKEERSIKLSKYKSDKSKKPIKNKEVKNTLEENINGSHDSINANVNNDSLYPAVDNDELF